MIILNQIIALLPIPLIFIAVGLFGRYAQLETKKYEPGQKVFTCIRAVKMVGIVGGVVVIASCIGYFIEWANPTRDGLLSIAILFSVISLPLMLFAFNMRYILEDKALAYYPPLGKPKRILFSDIASIAYEDFTQEYNLQRKDGLKISLNIKYMGGYEELLKGIEEKSGTKVISTSKKQ